MIIYITGTLITLYSQLPITQTFKENCKKYELSGVWGIESSSILAGCKEKKQFLLHSAHFYNI